MVVTMRVNGETSSNTEIVTETKPAAAKMVKPEVSKVKKDTGKSAEKKQTKVLKKTDSDTDVAAKKKVAPRNKQADKKTTAGNKTKAASTVQLHLNLPDNHEMEIHKPLLDKGTLDASNFFAPQKDKQKGIIFNGRLLVEEDFQDHPGERRLSVQQEKKVNYLDDLEGAEIHIKIPIN
jgi:hypothetical protein